MVQKAFDYTALIALSITSAVLIALAMVSDGWALKVAKADLSLDKNQLHPKIGEPEAHAAQAGSKDEVNRDENSVIERQGQWI